MFLNTYWENHNKLMKFNMLFQPSYRFWVDKLLEYCMQIFTLENLPPEIPQHESDITAFLKGYSAVVKLANGKWIIPPETGLFGLTDYYDEFTDIDFTTPLHFGKREIGKNAFIIRNTALKNPLLPMIQRYATFLSHAEISLICEMVNIRDDALFEAMTESQRAGIDEYLNDKYNGKIHSIVNKGFSMIQHEFKNRSSQGENIKLWDLRNDILSSFLEDIGIKKANEKRERQITSEVNANNVLLKLNIANMHKVRIEDWDKFNEATGHNVKVICNVDYDAEENENVSRETLKEGAKNEIAESSI